jgi:hypothetical protein
MKEQPNSRVDKMVRCRSVQQLQPSTKKSAMSMTVKEEEDIPPSSSRKRPPVRGTTKSLDGDVFRGMLDQDSDKPGTASNAPTPAKSKGASPAALSSFTMEQPNFRVDKMVRCRSVQQLQPSTKRSAMSKRVKEAEDVPPGKPRKNSSINSFEDELPGSPPERAPPTASKSLDEYEFRRIVPSLGKIDEDSDKLGTFSKARKSAKPKKEQPKLRVDKMLRSHSAQQLQPSAKQSATSTKVKEAEDVPPGKRRKNRSLYSFGDELPGSPPERAPPTASKSLDENEFRRIAPSLCKVDEDRDKPGTASKAPKSAKPKKEQPKLRVDKMLRSHSAQQLQPFKKSPVSATYGFSTTFNKVKEAEDIPPVSPRRRPPVRGVDYN